MNSLEMIVSFVEVLGFGLLHTDRGCRIEGYAEKKQYLKII